MYLIMMIMMLLIADGLRRNNIRFSRLPCDVAVCIGHFYSATHNLNTIKIVNGEFATSKIFIFDEAKAS
mgnify:CR=1 FL=1